MYINHQNKKETRAHIYIHAYTCASFCSLLMKRNMNSPARSVNQIVLHIVAYPELHMGYIETIPSDSMCFVKLSDAKSLLRQSRCVSGIPETSSNCRRSFLRIQKCAVIARGHDLRQVVHI